MPRWRLTLMREAIQMAERRTVHMETPDGMWEDHHGLRGEERRVFLVSGVKYVVLPTHPNRKRHRGRECVFRKPRRVRDDTGRETFRYMAWVQFVDDARFGFVNPIDMIPVQSLDRGNGQ